MAVASISDFREVARRRLPRFVSDYVDGGSFTETTLARNESDLAAIVLRQRVLRDVSSLDITTEIFGERLAMPVALAPLGFGGLLARRGECQAVRAADAAGIPFTLSTLGVCPLAEIARAATKPFWFQLYMLRDRGFMREMLAKASLAGCSTLLFTVDLPVTGRRYRDIRSNDAGTPRLVKVAKRFWQTARRPQWAWNVGLRGRPIELGNIAQSMGHREIMDTYAWLAENFDPAITWRDLDFIRAEWPGTLVLKGILDPEDAREAVRLGAEGIIVSNHGGRQLDGVQSTVRALPPIVDAVAGELSLLADGGVRSGLDVIRLLALGASCVMIGRPWAWALAAGGEAGVRQALRIIEDELRVAMALTGVRSIAEIDRTILAEISA